jgi:hypothetical protein
MTGAVQGAAAQNSAAMQAVRALAGVPGKRRAPSKRLLALLAAMPAALPRLPSRAPAE